MKKKLSHSISLYSKREKDILRYFSIKEYNIDNVTEYCSSSMMPLVVVYFYLYKNGEEDARNHMERLAEYYDIEVDV